MKLTIKELEKINNIPCLVELCKVVINIVERGARKEYCIGVLEDLTAVFKKECPLFRLINQGL